MEQSCDELTIFDETLPVFRLTAGRANGHHDVLLTVRVDRANLLIVDLEQFILLHKHVDDLLSARQVTNRLGSLYHDVARLSPQYDVRQYAYWVLLLLDAHAHFVEMLLSDQSLCGGRFSFV